MGGDNIARLKMVEAIAEGNIKVIPDILVSSNGTSGNLSDMMTLFLTQEVMKDTKRPEGKEAKKIEKEPKKAEEEEF
jgi:protein-tyrosine-phosphatase